MGRKPHYVELHSHSYYSLLDGASSPEALAARAAALEMPALALTDHDAVYGAVPFVKACQSQGIHPILGAEMTLTSGHHLTLLVADEKGWHNLCTLITLARHHAPKGAALLPVEALAEYNAGLIALSGCRNGEVAQALLQHQPEQAIAAAHRYLDWFGKRFWIELQQHFLPDDRPLNDALVTLARRLKLGYIATNNVHYTLQTSHRLQDILVCIRHHTTLEEAYTRRRANSEYYLKSPQAMRQLFQAYPNAVSHTQIIADQCRFELRYGLQDLPVFPMPGGMTAETYLFHLCQQALPDRYSSFPPERVENLLSHELAIIARSGLSNYFLIVWDVVRFAREAGILCQGRGSAANSLVAYLLGISPVDPLAHDLVFERFLADERPAVPDIDIDFQADRREEVIQYMYQRYGADHTAMACTFVTFRKRSALRDVGKALGLPVEVIESAALIRARGDDLSGEGLIAQHWLELCEQIDGLPRHLGIHNGGMVITGSPLIQRIPTEPATMQDRVVVQWDKTMLEDAGLVKIDILGLRMLSAIAETTALIEQNTGTKLDLQHLTYDDSGLYAQITAADTIGVFQVESRAQAQVLPRLKPRTFNDLVVSISLIRPGPVQGNMVHPYLRRRFGEEPVSYAHPLLEAALRETLGVILFQEQVLKVARDLAGFTPGQGELLRRALGNKRAGEALEQFHTAFVKGAWEKAVPEATAEEVFNSLRAFGGYSFPKSHAAAFAVLVYQSAWLKHYYPAAFYVALLNHQPMGFWSPAVIVNDARRRGLEVRRVDIHRSHERCTWEDEAIRLGFRYIHGLGESHIQHIEAARETGLFTDLADFYRRTELPRKLVENLILAGAMDDWGISRRRLLWELGTVPVQGEGLKLTFPEDDLILPPMPPLEHRSLEVQVLGLAVGDHFMAFYRERLRAKGILSSGDLPHCQHGEMVQVAGLVVMHQSPPTAKGFHFITLEDEMGMMNIIVNPRTYTRYRRTIRSNPLLLIKGKVQHEGDITNVLCSGVWAFPSLD